MRNETTVPDSPLEKAAKYRDEIGGQFVMLPMAVLLDVQDGKLTYKDVCVYAYLLAKQGQNERLWWGIEGLTELTGIGSSGLKESFAKLSAAGHIKRQKKLGGNSDTYCHTRVDEGGKIILRGERLRRGRIGSEAKEPIAARHQSGRILPAISFTNSGGQN